MGHPLAILDGDDGGLYDYIYASLEFLLNRIGADAEHVLSLVPESGPDHDTVELWSDIGPGIFDNLSRAQSTLRRAAIRRNAPLYDEGLDKYFGLYDRVLDDIAKRNGELVADTLDAHPRLRFLLGEPSDDPTDRTEQQQERLDRDNGKQKGKGGRPRNKTPYEAIERAYQELAEEFEFETAEHNTVNGTRYRARRPTQEEVCERLACSGIKISPRPSEPSSGRNGPRPANPGHPQSTPPSNSNFGRFPVLDVLGLQRRSIPLTSDHGREQIGNTPMYGRFCYGIRSQSVHDC